MMKDLPELVAIINDSEGNRGARANRHPDKERKHKAPACKENSCNSSRSAPKFVPLQTNRSTL